MKMLLTVATSLSIWSHKTQTLIFMRICIRGNQGAVNCSSGYRRLPQCFCFPEIYCDTLWSWICRQAIFSWIPNEQFLWWDKFNHRQHTNQAFLTEYKKLFIAIEQINLDQCQNIAPFSLEKQHFLCVLHTWSNRSVSSHKCLLPGPVRLCKKLWQVSVCRLRAAHEHNCGEQMWYISACIITRGKFCNF